MSSQEKYINPFTDFGFKKLFGTEFNKELFVDFLNQVLGEREQVKDLTYLNTENQGRTENDRKAMFDLYCENENGEKFIIEIQNVSQLHFKDRKPPPESPPKEGTLRLLPFPSGRGRGWGFNVYLFRTAPFQKAGRRTNHPF